MKASDRPLEIAVFLEQSGWGNAQMQAFAGDFSTRRYARLTRLDGRTGVLMDADAGQKTKRFVSIAASLRNAGIRAPEIYVDASDMELLLLEDFGARNVGAVIDAGEAARPFFLRAAELLATLHKNFEMSPSPLRGEGVLSSCEEGELPHYNVGLFAQQAELFLDAYIPYVLKRAATEEEREDFRAAWKTILRSCDALPKSLLLRDFMPDNLMDLASGELGVLDFQDAGIGPIAYDLASLCEEVRRDGGFALLRDVIVHYHEKSGCALSKKDLLRACVVLSAQRHTRILGIIAQVASRPGSENKIAFLPRVQKHLKNLLQDPALLPVKVWMEGVHVL